jgi:hypothetical protein
MRFAQAGYFYLKVLGGAETDWIIMLIYMAAWGMMLVPLTRNMPSSELDGRA